MWYVYAKLVIEFNFDYSKKLIFCFFEIEIALMAGYDTHCLARPLVIKIIKLFLANAIHYCYIIVTSFIVFLSFALS